MALKRINQQAGDVIVLRCVSNEEVEILSPLRLPVPPSRLSALTRRKL
jgi:hypothetical protein